MVNISDSLDVNNGNLHVDSAGDLSSMGSLITGNGSFVVGSDGSLQATNLSASGDLESSDFFMGMSAVAANGLFMTYTESFDMDDNWLGTELFLGYSPNTTWVWAQNYNGVGIDFGIAQMELDPSGTLTVADPYDNTITLDPGNATLSIGDFSLVKSGSTLSIGNGTQAVAVSGNATGVVMVGSGVTVNLTSTGNTTIFLPGGSQVGDVENVLVEAGNITGLSVAPTVQFLAGATSHGVVASTILTGLANAMVFKLQPASPAWTINSTAALTLSVTTAATATNATVVIYPVINLHN